jgi:hypothetical protein
LCDRPIDIADEDESINFRVLLSGKKLSRLLGVPLHRAVLVVIVVVVIVAISAVLMPATAPSVWAPRIGKVRPITDTTGLAQDSRLL